MVRAAPGGSIVGSVRGSARIGPPHKQTHQIMYNVPKNSHKCLVHVQAGVGDVRRNFTLLLGRFLPSEGPPRGVSSYPKRRGGKLHGPRLCSNTRSVLDSLSGAGPSKDHAKPCFSPQPSQNDLERGRPHTILTNALKLIFE